MLRIKSTRRPTVAEIQDELAQLRYKNKRVIAIRNVLILLLIASAMLIIVTNLWFPVLRVSGSSMQPVLKNEDVILCINQQKDNNRGDIIVFYHNDKVLIRRIIGIPGDVIKIDEAGVVHINGQAQLEAYATVLALEPCDIEFPVTVPEGKYFVLGDQRSTSMDSRSETVGMIDNSQLIGKALFRVWPLDTLKNLQTE
ncbi:MAG: signal peptidase I [Ruminococcus sp.]|nr:signal peptidase I [Ruminococcus sp.]